MGWLYADRSGHEGYVRGFVKRNHAYRPLGYVEMPDYEGPVDVVAAECECGWRSPFYHAPATAKYVPHAVLLHDRQLDDALHELWLRHMDGGGRPLPECLVYRAVVKR